MDIIDTSPYCIEPGTPANLAGRATKDNGDTKKNNARDILKALHDRMENFQERLFAESKQSLLIVLQAMDTGGKDSTIREVVGPLNPQGVRIWNFKKPSSRELAHDYLWRVHHRAPGRGYIGVFNRSHYEDVLIVRVKDLVHEEVWRKRYEHINAFEKLLTDEGTTIIKFFLHISKDHQKDRLQRRLDRPHKHWKFNPDDLKERARWDDYMAAYEDAISNCSTAHAPWYVVPAETRWWRDVIVASVICDALARMDPQLPEASFDPATITIE